MECLYLPSPSEKIINLKNVSTIQLDSERKKIIFNFINSINIMDRETPDYCYQNFKTPEETEEAFEALKQTRYIKENFIISKKQTNRGEILNKNFITSINIDERRKRIIFNLNFSITIFDTKLQKPIKISKFVYFDYKSVQQMKEELGKFIGNLI